MLRNLMLALVAGAVSLGVVLAPGPEAAAAPTAADTAALEANRAQWESQGISDYRLTTIVTCFCIEIVPVTVEVRGGETVSVDPADTPAFNVFTVEALLRRVEEAIARGVDSLTVTYDPENGIPTSIAIDEDFRIADEEVFIDVVDFVVLDPGGLGVGQRTQTLVAEWNLVGWTGATAVAEATASIAGLFDGLFAWDVAETAFRSYAPVLPPGRNTLTELTFGQGLWVHVTDPAGAAWTQPVVTGPVDLELSAGMNLTMWAGPDGTAVAEAVAGLGRALQSVYQWEAGAQAYLLYRPGAAAFLNTAGTLNHGAGVWVEVDRAVTWSQPAAGPPPREVARGEVVAVAAGATVAVADSPLRLTFVGVREDSRCPSDVVCVFEGLALVDLLAEVEREVTPFSITVPGGGGAEETVGTFIVEAVSLAPSPLSTAPIAAADYRLELRVRDDPLQPVLTRAPIEAVEVRLAESFPVQVFVGITSLRPDSCHSFDHLRTTQRGTSIQIDVWNLTPPPAAGLACALVVGSDEHNVALGSEFISGLTYTVRVNAVVRTFEAP